MKKSLSEKVSLYRGDITLLEVDAIVNAGEYLIFVCVMYLLYKYYFKIFFINRNISILEKDVLPGIEIPYVLPFWIRNTEDLFYVCVAVDLLTHGIHAKLRLGYCATGKVVDCCRKFFRKNFRSSIIVGYMLELIIGQHKNKFIKVFLSFEEW